MKKLVLFFAVIVAVTLSSCGKKQAAPAEEATADTTATAATADTTATVATADTTAAATAPVAE